MKKLALALVAAGLMVPAGWSADSASAKETSLAALVAEDLRHEIRPGGVNGSPFWNLNARLFMYPPAFDFPKDARAKCYCFDVVDSSGKCHTFWAEKPTASLAPVWEKLPAGWTSVSCRSVDQIEGRHMLKGCRVFWKQAPFTGNYPAATRGYRECADLALEWIFNQPSWKKFMATKNASASGYWGFCYPSKMVAALVSALCGGAVDDIVEGSARQTNASRIAAARLCADWLISLSEGADQPLAFFPPTYYVDDEMKKLGGVAPAANDYLEQVMLIYPAAFGKALLKLYAVTKEERYLTQARGIAETYLKLQGQDGTWLLKMALKTGAKIDDNRLVPIASVIPFLSSLAVVTGDERYRAAADRAFAYIENGPMKTWNWEGQFEDVRPDGAYRNLTKHDACATAIYICERYPKDRARLAVAREILRWAEDQFVCWEKPFPDLAASHDTQIVANWILPGVMEQYYWYVPIDASASKLIRTYLALYRIERNPLDLAKAKALGDAMTRMQQPNGDIPTHWYGEKGCSWWNCLLADVDAMAELAEVVEAEAAKTARPRLATFSSHIAEVARQRGVTIAEAVKRVKALGIEGVDVFAAFDHGEAEQILAAGMEPSTYILSVDFAHSDDAAKVEQAFAFVAKYHCPRIMLVPGYMNPGEDRETAWRAMRPRLVQLVQRARAQGVKVELEDFDAKDAVVGSAAHLRRAFREIPHLGHVFDTGNFAFWGDDPAAALEEFRSRIGHVHVKDLAPDGKSVAAGTGRLPIRALVGELVKGGYANWLTIECFNAPDMDATLKTAAALLREYQIK